jgi:glycosyltransferase involved in cell wall biosynthesis
MMNPTACSPLFSFNPRKYLLDVSRLVWRAWRGGLPTGIDRVCLAYVEHFGSRSQAVLQRKGFHLILSPAESDNLFKLLVSGRAQRYDLIRFWLDAGPAALIRRPKPRAVYLNVGHTGLNEKTLPRWLARHQLRAVYLIHDLIPLTHPEFCRDGEAQKHRRRMVNVLASAAGVICNSKATLDDLWAFAAAEGLPRPPSIAAWISGNPIPFSGQPKTLSKPYFITVGTIEGRKNHQLLLDVWRRLVAELGDDAPVLLIVGQRGWQADHVFQQLDCPGELEVSVRELRTCSDDELAGWTAGARAVLMPSLAEGFGLPLVEALQIGTPVIASDLPVFHEIAGDIPTYLAPLDGDAWLRAIRAFLGASSDRIRQIAQMKSYRAPTWDGHFAVVEPWLNSLENRTPLGGHISVESAI